MSDTLARRVGRLVSGSFHALIDAAENTMPEASMQEAMRDVARTLDEVKHELGKVVAQKHLANRRLADENNAHEALSEHIHIALANGRDDLAEMAVAEQMDIEARLPVLASTIADNAQQEQKLEAFVVALQAKERQMQQQLQQWQQMQKMADSKYATPTGAGLSQLERQSQNASSQFNRIWERETGVSVQNQVQDAVKMQELEALTRQHRIEERLAAFKAKNQS